MGRFDIDQDQKAAASAQQNYCYVSSSVWLIPAVQCIGGGMLSLVDQLSNLSTLPPLPYDNWNGRGSIFFHGRGEHPWHWGLVVPQTVRVGLIVKKSFTDNLTALEYKWKNGIALIHQGGVKDQEFLSVYDFSHLEYNRVNVLSKQVEEKPVSHVALADDRVYAFFFHTPATISHFSWSSKVIHSHLYLRRSTNALMYGLKTMTMR